MKSQVLCKNSIKLKPNCKQLCRIKLESDVYMQNLSVCPDAKASPFGRGVTAGDGEGKLRATEPPHGDRKSLCQSETIATSAILWQRPCPLRRFAPALPKGEPLYASCQLFHAPLRYAVVTVLIEIILDAGLLRHRYDPGGVSGAAKRHHERQLVRCGDAQ